jgi:hemerythrin-like metal-binding protein
MERAQKPPGGKGGALATHEQEYSDTGYAPIDEEHRQVSGLLRALVTVAADNNYAAAVEALKVAQSGTATHFAHEERLMKDHAFPNHQRHAEAHASFLADMARHAGELAKKRAVTPEFRRWVHGRLLDWFRHHVMANDVELGRFLQGDRPLAASLARSTPLPRR